MEVSDVLLLLEENKNERGIENWKKLRGGKNTLKSFGIGLTILRKLAKQIGRNRDLALELWESDYYDAKIISLLIDDPKLITVEQAESQVEQLQEGHLAHVFSSCNATLAKTAFTVELSDKWIKSDHHMRRSCGYGLLYETSKSKKKSAPDNAYFIDHIKTIESLFDQETIPIQMAMAGALMGMGMRNAELNTIALRVARLMGPIKFDKSGKCAPFDVAKNLTSDYAKQKFGL